MTTLLRVCWGVLLRLYPADLRREFERELRWGFDQALSAGRGVGEVADLARNLPGAWLERVESGDRVFSMGGGGGMDGIRRDLAYALRSLLRRPGFTAVVVITLGIGVGANAGVFGVLDAVLLDPFSWEDEEELVFMWESYDVDQAKSLSYLNFVDWRDRNRVFDDLGAHTYWTFTLTGEGDAAELTGHVTSNELYRVLGVTPLSGRLITAEDEAEEARVVLLSEGLWRERFGADPGVLGRSISLSGEPWEVVGVLPAGVDAPLNGADVYTPITTLAAGDRANRGSHPGLIGFGRLRDGVDLEAAAADMERVTAALAEEHPEANRLAGANLVSYRDRYIGSSRNVLRILAIGSGLFLLLVCANVANLLVARSTARGREVAVRAALGAGRGRLARLFLFEVGILSAAAAVVGFGVAAVGLEVVSSLRPGDLPRIENASVDPRLFLISLALGAATAMTCGLVPALRASRTSPQSTLRTAGGAGGGRRRGVVRRGLVVTEVAMATGLLVGAGLMARSVANLTGQDTGLDTDGVLVARVPVAEADYPTSDDRAAVYRDLIERVNARPGVISAAGIDPVPLDSNNRQFTLSGAGIPSIDDEEGLRVDTYTATPDYFTTMDISIVAGRAFDGSESPDDRRVLIDERLVERIWPGEAASDVLGRVLRFRGDDAPPLTVAGVVGHVRHYGFREEGRGQLYLPYTVTVWAMSLVVRTDGDPLAAVAGVRADLADVDPDIPLTNVGTMSDLVDRQTAEERLLVGGLALLGLVGVALAVLGLHAVLVFGVLSRTREIGIRMALGARRPAVVRGIVAEGVLLTCVGIALGSLASFGAERVMGALLFGVGGVDPLTLSTVALGFAGVAAIASLGPARRVASIDPAATLRAEG